jgi:hypothetical protein
MTCTSGKRLYADESLAIDALIEAHIQFEFRPGGGPVTIYHCDECGHYHLTSKGIMHERLAKMLTDGTIAKLKEANRWHSKFR